MDDDPRDPGASTPVRAPVARVALVRKPMVIAAPVRVIVVEEPAVRRPLPRAAVVGGSVWVLPKEYAVDELPLGD